MRKNLDHLKQYSVPHPIFKEYGEGLCGFFIMSSPCCNHTLLRIQSSDGKGWDHVSISTNKKRMPNWEEMCFVKDLFFDEEETVIQFHPKKTEYINQCENCLHLWRMQGVQHELPPSFLVGIDSIL